MAVEFLINRLKALLVLILGVFKRAMCCLRRRRRSSCDVIPLSNVGVVPNVINNSPELQQWDQWEENPVIIVPDKPVNPVQAKIEQYRQQIVQPLSEAEEEQQRNFFEDMTPKITRQTKVLIKDKQSETPVWNATKFAASSEPMPTNDLGEWEENTGGWEEQTAEEFGDPTKILREQKRREREQRLLEQHQRRSERSARLQPLGAKLAS